MSDQTYWSGKGKYQKEYDQIWKDYVPENGFCENDYAEQMRIISRIYYGLFNNGDFSIDNGDYHLEFPNISVFKEELPDVIEEFMEYMKDLEDYINRKGEYEESYDESYNEDSDEEELEDNKAYLDSLSYSEQQRLMESVADASIKFAYEKLVTKNDGK